MKISTLRSAARRHGLRVTKVVPSEEPDTEDDSIELSNGVSIQMSLDGVPQGVHGVVTVPEWTDFNFYWAEAPTADEVMHRAELIGIQVRDHLDRHKEP